MIPLDKRIDANRQFKLSQQAAEEYSVPFSSALFREGGSSSMIPGSTLKSRKLPKFDALRGKEEKKAAAAHSY